MMRIYLSLLLLSFVLTAKSQFQKGNVLLNGSGTFTTSNNTPTAGPSASSRTSGIGLTVSVSRFASNKAFNSLGVHYSYMWSKMRGSGSVNDSYLHSTGVALGIPDSLPWPTGSISLFPLRLMQVPV